MVDLLRDGSRDRGGKAGDRLARPVQVQHACNLWRVASRAFRSLRADACPGRLAPLTATCTTATACVGTIADPAVRTADSGLRTTLRIGARASAGRAVNASGSALATTACGSDGTADAVGVAAASPRSRIVLLPRASYTDARKPRGGSGPVPASAWRALPLRRRSG